MSLQSLIDLGDTGSAWEKLFRQSVDLQKAALRSKGLFCAINLTPTANKYFTAEGISYQRFEFPRRTLAHQGRTLVHQGAPWHTKGAPWYIKVHLMADGAGNAKVDLGGSSPRPPSGK
jgi:hypothetical protein